MLTEDVLRNLLGEVTYRPGWKLKLHRPDPYQGLYLSIIANVENAYDPAKTIELRIHSQIPPVRTAADFFQWLCWRLAQIAVHESMEFFQVDGKPWADPHKGM